MGVQTYFYHFKSCIKDKKKVVRVLKMTEFSDMAEHKKAIKVQTERAVWVANPPPPPTPYLADLSVDIDSIVLDFFTKPSRVEGDDMEVEEKVRIFNLIRG